MDQSLTMFFKQLSVCVTSRMRQNIQKGRILHVLLQNLDESVLKWNNRIIYMSFQTNFYRYQGFLKLFYFQSRKQMFPDNSKSRMVVVVVVVRKKIHCTSIIYNRRTLELTGCASCQQFSFKTQPCCYLINYFNFEQLLFQILEVVVHCISNVSKTRKLVEKRESVKNNSVD